MADIDVSTARALATFAHHRVVDHGGVPYIEHARAVAQSVAHLGPEFEMVGWLHDVVEDTVFTLGDLRRIGFPSTAVAAVDAVTKREGEDYLGEFIPRVREDPIAREVKAADIRHNLDPFRPWQPPESYRARGLAALALLWEPDVVVRDAADEDRRTAD